NSSSTSTTNTTIPPPPKPAPSSTTSSAASGLSAGSMSPKLNSGHLTTRTPSPLMTNTPSVSPSAARPKPSANSSGALIAPAVPANAPSRSSNNSKPKLKPPPPHLSNPTHRYSNRRLYPLHPKPLHPKLASFHRPPFPPTLLPTGSFTRFHVPHSQPHSQPGTNKNDGEW